jgi:DNA-binding NtrC family response regulator
MLSGYRVLIVEDEAIIAQDLSDAISEAEGEVVGPCSGAREASAILKTDARITAAVLDVNVRDGTVTPVLEALRAQRIPTLIYTGGQVPEDVRRRHPDLVVLSKPVRPARLIAELRRLSGGLAAK